MTRLAGLVRSGRLVATLVRLSLLNEMQYRANFFVSVFQSLLALATGLAVILLVYGNVAELNGWTRSELLVVLGVYTVLGGAIATVIQPNMVRLMDDIQQGTLDHVLVKPVDAQLYVSFREVQIWSTVDVIAGIVVIAVGTRELANEVTIGSVLAFAAMLVLGVVMVYCFWLALTTTAFRLVRTDSIVQAFEGVFQAGRWPVGIYPSWLRVSLTFLVPIAFAVTVPAEALTGRLDAGTVALATLIAIALVVSTRWLFRRGLRTYSGA